MSDFDTTDLVRNLRALEDRIRAGAAQGLGVAAEYVLEESTRLVPLDEGTLLRSGRTAVDKGALRAAVGYGQGGAEAYARRQHEDTSLNHPNGGGPKYLERALVGARRVVGDIIARSIRSHL